MLGGGNKFLLTLPLTFKGRVSNVTIYFGTIYDGNTLFKDCFNKRVLIFLSETM